MTPRSTAGLLLPLALFAALTHTLPAQLPTLSDVDRGSATGAAGPLPAWDVAVVKPHDPGDHTMSWRTTPDSVELVNLGLEQMICSAWDLKPYQITGLSGWMTGSAFDLTAKVSGDDVARYKALSTAQRRQMLQELLAERFQLKTHLVTRTLPVYDLIVGKGGSKLKSTTALEPPSEEELRTHPEKYKMGTMRMGPGMYEGTGVSVRSLSSQLGNAVGKPVVDRTGLSGTYDITLHYSPGEGAPETGNAPSVFTAVEEQLGLKLVANKGPVETLVVDSAAKPGEN